LYSNIVSTSGLAEKSVLATIKLLEDGATIPFIARYRKEATFGLDEIEIALVSQLLVKNKKIAERKTTILAKLTETNNLTDELKLKIETCWNLVELEDLYLPFKVKRKTKASVAVENGLEPLAGTLMKQELNDVIGFAQRFIKNKVTTVDEALEGAKFIMAEWINERGYIRNSLRYLFEKEAVISSKKTKNILEGSEKYQDYFDYSEKLNRIQSHRILALLRAENEGVLNLTIAPLKDAALDLLNSKIIKGSSAASTEVKKAIQYCYTYQLRPSLDTEFKNAAKEKADEKAILIFAENLKQLLLTPPLGQKRILAIDPGFKSGCKVVCLDAEGNLLYNETIFPHAPQNQTSRAASKINQLVSAYKTEFIAIGNGTAGRETEEFIQKKVRFDKEVKAFVVNEAGASVYSASSIAREEFPQYDVTVRGAVSIGRRLSDPLAELVKIDPKSIGVGQYQHDVHQNMLKDSLDLTVEHCVNLVGVNLNTASKHLLTYISGLGGTTANNVVELRKANGAFTSREQLKKVKGIGDKAFEQCAGFLRIKDAKNPLDNSSIHPESYYLVEKISKKLKVKTIELFENKEALDKLNVEDFIDKQHGVLSIKQIISELEKPNIDPRRKQKHFEFDKSVRSMHNLKEGMLLPGLISNITTFGAFVNLGVKQDGLVHKSQLADRYVSDPIEVVRLNQQVIVKVLSVDVDRKRIQLTMKGIDQS
jgi:protein Tex|tara:strand:+ start:2250 stop:4376 length:2127 start_codon:yes stop_codon:yes gene_type:complete